MVTGRRIWFKDEKEFYALHWDNQDFDEYTRFDDFPFHAQNGSGIFCVAGTCNGLVCLANDSERCDHNFILWNLCVRKFVQLPNPKPNIKFPTNLTYIALFGFGFDSKTNDYKVVRIMTFRDRGSLDVGESSLEVEVYSLAIGEWKTLTAFPPTSAVCYNSPCVYVNGALRWVASRKIKDNIFLDFVLVLDLEDEVFREIAMPKFVEDQRRKSLRISAYGNSLAVFHWVSIHNINIWLMKEYGNAFSWTKIVIVVDQDPKRYIIGLNGFRKSGEVIFFEDDEKLVSRSLET